MTRTDQGTAGGLEADVDAGLADREPAEEREWPQRPAEEHETEADEDPGGALTGEDVLADTRRADGEIAVERDADDRAGSEGDRVEAVLGDAELVRQEQRPAEHQRAGGVHPP